MQPVLPLPPLQLSLQPQLTIVHDIVALERLQVLASVREFVAAVGGDKFLGGDSPSLADVCVYGCLRGVVWENSE